MRMHLGQIMVRPQRVGRRASRRQNMAMTFHDECPICNALVSYSTGAELVCPHCGNKLLIGSSDPTGHDISEIDPDVGEGRCGVFHLELHPLGTRVCVVCRKIFSETFECCPALVDLACASYGSNVNGQGPKTKERIAEFLKGNPKVVANTARLRAIQHRHGKLDRTDFAKMRTVLEALGMIALIADIEERK